VKEDYYQKNNGESGAKELKGENGVLYRKKNTRNRILISCDEIPRRL
ncbi:11461_t:CDS:1, partial [Racocetra persica]